MGQRLDLHSDLVSILGSSSVYFQPPETLKLSYPCIIYGLDDIDSKYADNKSYANTRRYMVTIVDRNPDSQIPEKIIETFSKCSFNRYYAADNLHHTALVLYY